MSATKVCKKCGETKPISEFRKESRVCDGLTARCKDCINAMQRLNNVTDETRSRYAGYRQQERYRQIQRNWRENNRERKREQARKDMRKKRLINPEPLRARATRWKQSNPDRVLTINRARAARKQNAPGSHTTDQWLYLCMWFGNCCVCCGITDKLTADHVMPLSRGGSNSIDNLQPLCGLCNSRKHTQTVDYRDPDLLAMLLGGLPNELL